MKNFKFLTIAIAIMAFSLQSCVTVPAGHKGVEVSWGGTTNMDKVYDEGMHTGIGWLWNDMVPYNVKEKTITRKFTFNDKKDMLTVVTISMDYRLLPKATNQLHRGIDDVDVKIETSLTSAAKEVVPQYTAVELNKTGRVSAEAILDKILKAELPEFFVEYRRARITDVDIPKGISALAEQTAVQLGKNELASKMEQEKVFIANAVKAEAQGVADAAVITSAGNLAVAKNEAKTRDLLSSTKMLALQKVENERIMAEGYKEHGKSFYGTNNIFGANAASVIKGLNIGK